MSTALSIRTRALLAVALLVGFYALALALAGGLLYIPYAEWRYADRLHFNIAIFCVIGAFLILKAIVPQADTFEPPGPQLLPDAHPALFAMIDEVARATDQRPPAEVYLVSDVNAFVTERGGTMGFGSRRVMGVGLPLMELLSVDELRAVIAHEFGHYVSGDTRLGPWIHKTRAAIGRTLDHVSDHSALLAKPFEWYGTAFLRVTHAVSRAQEFVADATAARVAGTEAARRALLRIAGGAGVYPSYWRSEVLPVLELGYRPPLAEGFRQFLAAPRVAPVVEEIVSRELEAPTTDPFDTHPSLHDRIAALDRIAANGAAPATAPATAPRETASSVALLGDLDGAETALITSLASNSALQLAPVSWTAVPTHVLPLSWRQVAAEASRGLAGLTPEQLPALVAVPGEAARRFGVERTNRSAAERDAEAFGAIGSALAIALLRRAADAPSHVAVSAPPGAPIVFHITADAPMDLHVFDLCGALRRGEMSAEQWRSACEASGIAGIDLGPDGAGAANVLTPPPASG
jgi:heat shock protein HtpX